MRNTRIRKSALILPISLLFYTALIATTFSMIFYAMDLFQASASLILATAAAAVLLVGMLTETRIGLLLLFRALFSTLGFIILARLPFWHFKPPLMILAQGLIIVVVAADAAAQDLLLLLLRKFSTSSAD